MIKTHLQHLDDLVRWTGVPALAAGEPRRRPLRLVPTLALVAATTGFVTTLVTPDRFWLGYGLLMLGFSVANFIPIFGPLVPWAGPRAADEREVALRRSAFLVGLATVGVVAWLGLWVMVALILFQRLPAERIAHDLTSLAFYLTTLHGAVPTLWASWQLRPPPLED